MSRITGLKNKIDALRTQIISLKMTPTNQHLESLNHKINDLTDKLVRANEELTNRVSAEYVKTLDGCILDLKKEVAGKQITIDGLEFDMCKKEKRVKEENEITIKLSKEIQLLKIKEQCREDDIAALIDKLYVTDRGLKEANATIAKYVKEEDKTIKNRLKKLFAS